MDTEEHNLGSSGFRCFAVSRACCLVSRIESRGRGASKQTVQLRIPCFHVKSFRNPARDVAKPLDPLKQIRR